MTVRANLAVALSAVFVLVGCPPKGESTSGNAAGSTGNAGHAGSGSGVDAGSNQGGGTAAKGGGTGGKAGTAGAGAGGSGACPADIAIPALCKLCAGNTCGTPMCSGGQFNGFVCPSDQADGGANVGGVCNLACVKGKHCERTPTPTCVDDASGGGTAGGASASLHWFASCGAPVCQSGGGFYDDPSIANCTTQREGESCTTEGDRCDGVLACGATLICATEAPRTCPVSRARYKQDIRYLGEAERARFHDQITQLPLASYRYKSEPSVAQLGFMIDDIEPSVAVAGDHVNLYGYLSMAVAAIQVQDQEIKALREQVQELRARLGTAPSQTCEFAPQP